MEDPHGPRIIPQLIAQAQADLRLWHQDADSSGQGVCSGCGAFGPLVYGACLQWCQRCWSAASPYAPDTQTHDWEARRTAQEQDYGWSVSVPVRD